MLELLSQLLFASRCAACGADTGADAPFCPPCASSLVELGPACPRCAEPLGQPPSLVCARCRRTPLPLATIVAPWRYGGALGDALRRLKFAGHAHVARTLAPLVAPYLAATVQLGAIDLIVPVPLHWRRRARRGFDQAALLAAAAARRARVAAPIAYTVRRRRSTAPQTELAAAARAKNVAGAFAVPARRAAALTGRRVLVFDDVVTTGATMAAAARALRAAGASDVLGFCVARAEAS